MWCLAIRRKWRRIRLDMLSVKPRKRADEKGGGGGSFLDNITHRKSFNHISVRKLKNVEKCIVTMGYFNIDP